VIQSILSSLDPAQVLIRAGIEPDPWQFEVLRSSHRRILLNCSRQSGKSTVAAARAVHQALYVPGSLVLLISPSQRQSMELFRTCKSLYRDPSVLQSEPPAESLLRLELPNGSRILSLPGQDSATIRGFSGCSLLVVDEAARVSDDIYSSVRPMLAVSGGRFVGLSTPAGKRGWFHREWMGEGDWFTVQITASDCPRISPMFLAEEEQSLGPEMFAQEYGCEFLDDQFDVFDLNLVEQLLVDEPALQIG